MSNRLSIRDELYLLSHDEGGKPQIHVQMLAVGLAAALLMDLTLQGDIDTGSGRVLTRPRPGGVDQAGPSGGGITGQAVAELVAERSRPPSIADTLLAWQPTMYERVRGELVAGRILHSVKARRLGLVTVTRYKVVNESDLVRARTALRRAASGMVTPTPSDAALCGLIIELQLERALYLSSDGGAARQNLNTVAERNHPVFRRILTEMADVIRYRSTASTM